MLVMLTAVAVWPQSSRQTLSVDTKDVGVSGFVRPGQWTPLRVTVDNPSIDDLELRFTWSVRDADGDEVAAQRTAVINAQRRERLWLYAPIPMSASRDATWTVQAASTEDPGALAIEPVSVGVSDSRWVLPGTGVIALMSGQDLGLGDYAQHVTQHEPLEVVRDLSLADLPDNALGLAGLDAVIWTAETGGDPAGADTPATVFPALREYVLRGGHLVIVMPTVGETWTQSPLADFLPVAPERVRRETGPVPRFGGTMLPDVESTSFYEFDVRDAPDAAVLFRNEAGRPLVVQARRGFGTVTLIGMDLTKAEFSRQNAADKQRLWNTVFGWTSPVWNANQVRLGLARGESKPPTLKPADDMVPRALAGFVPGRVAMRGTISTILLVAMALLMLYVAAAAVSFFVLRGRGAARHAWAVFGLIVLGFSVVAWSGAWVARPATLQAQHFSVMDVDGAAGTARVRSWVSLFVPRFGIAEVSLPPDDFPPIGPVTNRLAALGFERDGGLGFLDSQRYVVDLDDPATLNLPVRSTTRRLTLDVLTSQTRDVEGPAGPASFGPASFVALDPPAHDPAAGTLTARLQHSLPGNLHDVTVVYCPGEGYRGRDRAVLTPWVWRPNVDAGSGQRAPWTPGQVLEINGRPNDAQRLVIKPDDMFEAKERNMKQEGFLGVLLDQQRGVAEQVSAGDDTVTREMLMLSFFDALPPPWFSKTDWPVPTALRRPLGRDLDLSDLLSGPRLIVLGNLPDGPLPADLKVDGRTPPATGWTLVRLIYDL